MTRTEEPSRRSRVGFIVAMISAAVVLIGTAVGAVSVGAGPISTSLSVGDVSDSALLFLIVLVIAGVAALLFARNPQYRMVAVVAIVAFVLIIGAAFYALSQADNPDGLLATVLTDITNPKPDFGFFLIVIGALGGLIGSIMVLADKPRPVGETITTTTITEP